eukprot:scaffold271119_cov31-Tisochrysis_lutea.AAC.1
MVLTDGFGVELLDATTSAPLTEHVDEMGVTWAEGVPGQQYWLNITVPEQSGVYIMTDVEVDGKKDGLLRNRFCPHPASQSRRVGVIKGIIASGEQLTYRALAFSVVQVEGADGKDEDGLPPPCGEVTVRFFEAFPTKRQHTERTWNGFKFDAEGKYVPSNFKNKKEGIGILKSTLGDTSADTKFALATDIWDQGRLLKELSLKYSTRFGLVVRRIVVEDYKPSPQQYRSAKRRRVKAENHAIDAVDLTRGTSSACPINLAED